MSNPLCPAEANQTCLINSGVESKYYAFIKALKTDMKLSGPNQCLSRTVLDDICYFFNNNCFEKERGLSDFQKNIQNN